MGSLLISFLGGGVAATIMQYLFQLRKDKLLKKIEFVECQLRRLYGPLFALITQTEEAFNRYKEIHKKYDEVYSKNWGRDSKIQEIKRNGIKKTLDLASKYIYDIVLPNNSKISDTLSNNIDLIDMEDMELVVNFFKDYNIYKIEWLPDRKDLIPPEMIDELGTVSYLRPDFIERIKNKFNNKVQEVNKLRGNKNNLKKGSSS